MRPRVRWLLTAVLAVLVAAPSRGQISPEVMRPFMEDGLAAWTLLRNKGVQRELRLTDEQRDKIDKIVKDALSKHINGSDIQKARTSGELLIAARETVRKANAEANDSVNKAIPNLLQEEQVKRLRQIELQVNALQSLNRPDIQRALQFTDKQKAEVKKLTEGFKENITKLDKVGFSEPPRDRRETVRKATELAQATLKMKEEANREALNLFTEEQATLWKDMTGEKFEYRHEIPKFPYAPP